MGACHSVKPKKVEEKDYIFYYKNEPNPWVKEENVEWKPYSNKDQISLKSAFSNFLKDPKTFYKGEISSKPDHYFDFKDWNEINKFTKEILPFKREYFGIRSNILRPKKTNKYLDLVLGKDPEPIIFEENLISKNSNIFSKGSEFESYKNTYDFNKGKNVKKVVFSVINQTPIQLTFKEELCFFENDYNINLEYKDFLKIIKDEVENMARLFDKNNQLKIYLGLIDQISNTYLFFNKIIQMFFQDGFLQQKINEFLAFSKSNTYEYFKIFYISLMASIKYCSENASIPNYQYGDDLIIYRPSKVTNREIEVYNTKKNNSFTRIFNEFLIGTRNLKYAKKIMDLDNENSTEYLWEILVPEYIINFEKDIFICLDNILPVPNYEEVLIKSGSVIFVDKIVPLYDEKNQKEYRNKFVVKCILRSWSFNSYLESLKLYYSMRNSKLKTLN